MVGCCGRGGEKHQGEVNLDQGGIGYQSMCQGQAGSRRIYDDQRSQGRQGPNDIQGVISAFRGNHNNGFHNEAICHGTGERRRDLMDQIKMFLDEYELTACTGAEPQAGGGAFKPLGSYPEYNRKHCASWKPAHPRPPQITSTQTEETRPTDDFKTPPPESCDCAKRNGLQDECQNSYCKPPKPECLATNPGPCCPPSLGLTKEMMDQGLPPPLLLEIEKRRNLCKNKCAQGSGQAQSQFQGSEGQGREQIINKIVCFRKANLPH